MQRLSLNKGRPHSCDISANRLIVSPKAVDRCIHHDAVLIIPAKLGFIVDAAVQIDRERPELGLRELAPMISNPLEKRPEGTVCKVKTEGQIDVDGNDSRTALMSAPRKRGGHIRPRLRMGRPVLEEVATCAEP